VIRDRINATMQEVNAHRLKEQMEYMEQQQAAAEKKTKGKGKGKGREKPQRDTKKRAAAAEEEEAADVPSKKKQKLQISATSEEQAAASFTKGANPKTVFVVNLPFSVDETQLKETFSKVT
jgi:RNA recognition motif-containing protein